MKKLCESVASLLNPYFFEPDVFAFTQTHWDIGNALWNMKENTEDAVSLLLSSGLSIGELTEFQTELLRAKSIMEEV